MIFWFKILARNPKNQMLPQAGLGILAKNQNIRYANLDFDQKTKKPKRGKHIRIWFFGQKTKEPYLPGPLLATLVFWPENQKPIKPYFRRLLSDFGQKTKKP